jgi:hypothetical protein
VGPPGGRGVGSGGVMDASEVAPEGLAVLFLLRAVVA